MKDSNSTYKYQLEIQDKEFNTTNYTILVQTGHWKITKKDYINYVLDKAGRVLQGQEKIDLVFFNPAVIVHPEQIKIACYHALSNLVNGDMLLNDRNLEYLLYLGQKRQIGKILEDFSLKRKHNQDYIETGILLISSNENNVEASFRNLVSGEEFQLVPNLLGSDFSTSKLKKFLQIYEIEENQLHFSLECEEITEITEKNWGKVQKVLLGIINERIIEFKLQSY